MSKKWEDVFKFYGLLTIFELSLKKRYCITIEDLFFKSLRLKFFIFRYKYYFHNTQPDNFFSSLCKIYLSIHLAKREKAFTTTTYFKKIHSLPTTNKSMY